MMKLSSYSCLLLSTLAFAAEAVQNRTAPCHDIKTRHEWRDLTVTQQQDYLNAVKCLQSKPSKGKVRPAAKTRFDDFQGSHLNLTDEVHLVGQFLVWHRFFIHLYEKALKEECGYQGTQPYWDWTLDVSDGMNSFSSSPVFDPINGFGGNGIDIPGYNGFFNNVSTTEPGWSGEGAVGGGCITDGPFASYNLSLGPGTLDTNHCITRWFTPVYFSTIMPEKVAELMKYDNFEQFRIELEGTPVTTDPKTHDGGHLAVSGEMSNRYSSPGDPLFYLHHSNLDRIWGNWQDQDPHHRLYEISGRSTVDPPFTNVTLDFVLPTSGLGTPRKIRELMDTRNEYLCYVYV